jgi:hypothetical protein
MFVRPRQGRLIALAAAFVAVLTTAIPAAAAAETEIELRLNTIGFLGAERVIRESVWINFGERITFAVQGDLEGTFVVHVHQRILSGGPLPVEPRGSGSFVFTTEGRSWEGQFWGTFVPGVGNVADAVGHGNDGTTLRLTLVEQGVFTGVYVATGVILDPHG